MSLNAGSARIPEQRPPDNHDLDVLTTDGLVSGLLAALGRRDLDLRSPGHRRTPDDSEVLVFQHPIKDDRGVEPTFTGSSCQEPAEPPCSKDVSQDKEPTATEYTPNLVETLPLIRPVVEAEGRQNKIEVGVGEREALGRAIYEVDASICPSGSSLLHHSGSGIHTDKLGSGKRRSMRRSSWPVPHPTSSTDSTEGALMATSEIVASWIGPKKKRCRTERS